MAQISLSALSSEYLLQRYRQCELFTALEASPCPRGATNWRYFFINGTGALRTAVSVIERCLRSVFKAYGVVSARPHRLRHTMADKHSR